MAEYVSKLNEENRKSVRKLIREAAETYKRAEKLLETAGEKHTNILIIMQSSGVAWGDITRTIQYEVFPEWPRKDSGLPQGYQDLMKQGYKPAIYLNRFIAWRDKYYRAPKEGEDFGQKREAAPPRPKLSEMSPEQRQTVRIEQSKKNTERRISAPHVINKDLVRHAFKELFTFAAVMGNAKAQDHLLAAFKSLGLFEGETLGKVDELVQTPEGEMVVPQMEEEKKVVNASSVH